MEIYSTSKRGYADRNSWIQIPKAMWDGISQETNNAVELEDQKFAQIVHVINGGSSSPGGPASGDVVQLGAIAEETVPTPVADGETVPVWVDTYGRLVVFGSNLSTNSQDVSVINDPMINRLGPITNLSAVTATGAGSSVDVSNYHNYTIQIVASSVTTGASVLVQHSLDGTNWATISTNSITSNGVTEITISQVAYRYLRTNVSSRTDGTYTTYIYAGN